MRRIAALLAFTGLTACGSGGNPIVERAWDEMQGFYQEEPAPGGAAARPLTRADVEAADVAAIWGRLGSDSAPTLLYATAENGPYVTYFSSFRQSVTLRGSQVTATRGLGWDLLSAWSSPGDPLAKPTPPASWPASVERTYEFPADGPRGRIETYRCTFERGPAREMVILQVRRTGGRVQRDVHRECGNLRESPSGRCRKRLRLAELAVDRAADGFARPTGDRALRLTKGLSGLRESVTSCAHGP